MQRLPDPEDKTEAGLPSASRDLRTQDFATPDAEPAMLLAGRDDADPLPNRRYTSILFWRLVRALDPSDAPARILDLVSTSQANIHFWAERGFRVTCYNLAHHELRRLGDEPISNLTLAPDKLRELALPFPDESFSAICAWNILARLPFMVARRYARDCYRIMHPRGILHAIFLDADGRLDGRREYRVADRQQLDVISGRTDRHLATDWVEAELAFLFSHFDACETKPAPCQTRELLAQRGPITPSTPARRRQRS